MQKIIAKELKNTFKESFQAIKEQGKLNNKRLEINLTKKVIKTCTLKTVKTLIREFKGDISKWKEILFS